MRANRSLAIFNSNRTGHLSAAFFAGLVILGIAVVLRDYQIVIVEFSIPLRNLAISGITMPVWEMIATPDVDIPTRSARRGPWYRRLWVWWWKPYAKMVSHRSKWSHSLWWGLPLRFIWGPMFWLLAPIVVPGPQVVSVAQGYLTWGPWVLFGMIAADTLHMVKARY